MTWMNGIRSLFRRRRFESDLDEELQFHIEAKTKENIAAGMPPKEARNAATRAFGNHGLVRESTRETWGFGFAERLWQDTGYALRVFRKNPGFTVTVLVTLALGIGANTAIFSIVYGVLMKPLPFDDAGCLVKIYQTDTKSASGKRMMSSPQDLEDARTENRAFEGLALFGYSDSTLTGRGQPEDVSVCLASSDLFSVLRTQPILGRAFSKQEQDEASPVAVISRGLWERSLGGDPSALGQSITLDGKPYTIVGVMPGWFHFPDRSPGPASTEIWLPIPMGTNSRGSRDTGAIGRLKSGVTIAQARQDMDTISARLAKAYEEDEDIKFQETPLLDDIVGEARPAVLIIFAAVAFVLLIACANVANLLLARGASRQKEIAIRAAIGASRSRIIRQLLTESVVLGLAGGVLGLAVAFSSIAALGHLAPKDFPRLEEVTVTPWVLAFNLGISVTVGILFGILPALQVSKASLLAALKDGSIATPARSSLIRRRTYANLLVIAQIAMSIVLLIGATLMTGSFLRLTSVDIGFNPSHLMTFRVSLPAQLYKSSTARVEFYQQSLERVRSLPGVEYASVSSFLALSGYAKTSFSIAGDSDSGAEAGNRGVIYKAITSDYFHCMGIPILNGRDFDQHDRPGGPPVVTVNEAFVRQYLGGGDALGKRINVNWGAAPPWSEIVGVVGDTRDLGLAVEPSPQVCAPLLQSPSAWIAFLVRTSPEMRQNNLAPSLRSAITSVDKDEPISEVTTMDQTLSDTVAHPRFQMALITAFSVLALMLTAVGLYGVLTYSVTERTHEIGVRMALGAQRRGVVMLVMRRGIVLALVGVAIGIGAAHWLTRLIAAMLYSVKPTDAPTLVGVSLLLIMVALVASYLPARRATKLDPLTALRYE
jgi:predicted permease